MLLVNKFKDTLKEEFSLSSDDLTIIRRKDGYLGRWKQGDVVTGYKLCSYGYEGIHIPRTRVSVNKSHLLTLLRGIDIPEGSVIDHIDGNSTNNARDNMRIVSQEINCRNAKPRINKSTGISGITKDKSGKFIVRLYLKGVRKYLGYRDTLEEAISLRDGFNVERKLDGYTARHNI